MNTKFNYAGFIDMFIKPEEQTNLVVARDRACPTVTAAPGGDMAQAVRPRTRQVDKTKS